MMVEMFDCPECAFSYDMVHRVDLKGNVYPCPCCEETRLSKEIERLRDAISDALPALDGVHEGKWHEYTGDLVLTEDQWGAIAAVAKELRATLSDFATDSDDA